MGDPHKHVLGKALAFLDNLTEEGRAKKPPIPMEEHLRLLRSGEAGIYRDEIIASRLMKQLTARFGTRGKTPKFIFLQAFEEELRGGTSQETEYLKNIGRDKTYVHDEKDFDDNTEEEDELTKAVSIQSKKRASKLEPKTMTDLLVMRNGHLGPIIERPAAMVSYSVFLHNLESQLKLNIHRLGCTQPIFETTWLFEEIKPNTGDESLSYYDTMSIRDTLDEDEEKLMKRLKLYRRAFSALVLHFEALRPVLYKIKKSYDHIVNVREHELKDARIMKQNIEHYKQLLDHKNANVKFEGLDALLEVQQQCLLLLHHIEKQEHAIVTVSAILNQVEFQLSDEHDLRRDSEDQQKLLLIEINDYRKKLGMEPRPIDYNSDIEIETLGELGLEDEEEEEEESAKKTISLSPEEFVMPRDPTITVNDLMILRQALTIARRDLKKIETKLAEMEKAHGDVIPRHQYLSMKQSIIDLETEHLNKQNQFADLASQVQGLQDQIEHLTQERTTLNEEASELRTKVTPRPSWEKMGEFIDGGIPKWKQMYEGKSSNETAEKLFLELTVKKPPGPIEYYSALGTAAKIPVYMRHDSRVRRRKLGRRDVAVMIHDLWESRRDVFDVVKAMDEEVEDEEELHEITTTRSEIFGESMPRIQIFTEYFLTYFTSHYKNVGVRMEWIYNLIENCKKLQEIDARFKLFLDVLEGRRSENVYHLFQAQITKLLTGLLQQSKLHQQPSGSLSLGTFSEAILLIFPYKTPDQIKRLAHAASKQCNVFAEWSIVKYKQFFTKTDEGYVGEFINEFMKQLDEDIASYSQEIIKYLMHESGVVDVPSTVDLEHASSSDKDISMAHFYKCLMTLDPSMPDEKIGQAICWIFLNEVSPPGSEKKVIPLVNIIKNNLPTAESPEFNDKVELEFERIVLELKIKTQDDEENLTPQKKIAIKKSKATTMGHLGMKLKSGALVRHGLQTSKRIEEPVKPKAELIPGTADLEVGDENQEPGQSLTNIDPNSAEASAPPAEETGESKPNEPTPDAPTGSQN